MSRLLPVITYRAWDKINSILQHTLNDSMLYSANSGGCNGFTFTLDILDNKTKNELDTKKIKPSVLNNPINNSQSVYIDTTSEIYLYNTEIDYIKEDYQKKIFESKFIFNVDNTIMTTCGCGTSFSIK